MYSRKYLFAVIIAVTLFSPYPVHAHGDARLEVNPERLSPGTPLTIRGVDFLYEEELSLVLIGPDYEFPIGSVTADVEGVFMQTINLPVDLQEGIYNIHAKAHDLEVVISPAVSVQGAPLISNEEGEGQRAEEESLLAPIPTSAPGVIPQNTSRNATQPVPQASQSPDRKSTGYIWLVLFSVGILVVFALRVASKNK